MNRPYRFGGFLNSMPVGEDNILPCMTIPPSFSCENDTSLYTREAFVWFSPYYLVLPLLIVGDDVLGVPFIKMSLRFARVVKGAVPYRFVWRLIFLIVGATIGRPRAFEERPYGFNDCLKIRL